MKQSQHDTEVYGGTHTHTHTKVHSEQRCIGHTKVPIRSRGLWGYAQHTLTEVPVEQIPYGAERYNPHPRPYRAVTIWSRGLWWAHTHIHTPLSP